MISICENCIDSLNVLRAKLAGIWNCARFSCILTSIKRDGYVLRQEYPERKCVKTWLRMGLLALKVVVQNHLQAFRHAALPLPSRVRLKPQGKGIQEESI